MRAKEITTPRSHHDECSDSQFCQLSIVAHQGSGAREETGERQCRRAHEFGRIIEESWLMKQPVRTSSVTAQGKHRYSDQFRKSSENKIAHSCQGYHNSMSAPSSPFTCFEKNRQSQSSQADRKSIHATMPNRSVCPLSTAEEPDWGPRSCRHRPSQK